jgi:His-Xaa-Ser system protein HxsD
MVEERHAKTPIDLIDGVVRICLDLKVYRLVAIQKAAYKLANRATVLLGDVEDGHVLATFLFGKHISHEDVQTIMRSFVEEVLDQELRERIGEETNAIRSLILAQAFSRTDLIRRE